MLVKLLYPSVAVRSWQVNDRTNTVSGLWQFHSFTVLLVLGLHWAFCLMYLWPKMMGKNMGIRSKNHLHFSWEGLIPVKSANEICMTCWSMAENHFNAGRSSWCLAIFHHFCWLNHYVCWLNHYVCWLNHYVCWLNHYLCWLNHHFCWLNHHFCWLNHMKSAFFSRPVAVPSHLRCASRMRCRRPRRCARKRRPWNGRQRRRIATGQKIFIVLIILR